LTNILDDDSKDSQVENLRAVVNGPWLSGSISSDAFKGGAFAVFGLDRIIVIVNSSFEFSYRSLREWYAGQKTIDGPLSKSGSDVVDVKESPVPEEFQSVLNNLKTLRTDAQNSTSEADIEKLNERLSSCVDKVYSIASSDEMKSLQAAQVEVETLSSRIERMEKHLKQSSKYSADDIAAARFLKDLQVSIPEYQGSLSFVIS
jgi:ribosomal protein S15P/S13E